MDQIGYSLQIGLDIDPCLQVLKIHIERLMREIHLLDYSYGKIEDFWLFGIARLR